MPSRPKPPTQIRSSRANSFRRHFMREWLEDRNMTAMDLLDLLNEPAGMDPIVIDKSQVYRWLKGQLPHRPTQMRIAAALQLLDKDTGEPDPERLLTHPAQDWIARKVSKLEPTEIERMKEIISLAFPDRTGTDG